MTVSVYLHDEIYQVLRCFGSLNEVVNRLLIEGKDTLPFEDVDNAPSRDGAKRYNIEITDAYFISAFVSGKPHYNLRGILYSFVLLEWYSELGWKITTHYRGKNYEKFVSFFNTAKDNLNKALYYCDTPIIKEQLRHIVEEVSNINV